jgi:hypothetical protein
MKKEYSMCWKFLMGILLPLLLVQQGCNKKDESDIAPPLPPLPISISIDWSTDPDRFSEDHLRWSGKASFTVDLNFEPETDILGNTAYFLKGSGSGTQYDCMAYVDPPDYIENVDAGDFTVSVFGGNYTKGDPSTYVFTLESENASFSFDLVWDLGGGEISRWPHQVDELESVISDIIFEMDAIKEFVFSKQDETLLGTEYVVLASWVY